MRRAATGVAVVLAASAGLVAGATMMAAVQDAGSSRATSPPTTATTTAPEPVTVPAAPAVLLAWTPGGLDPALAEAASAVAEVTGSSVVAGATIDLVASHDAAGGAVDIPDPGWAIPLDAVALDPLAHAAFAAGPDRAALASLAPDRAVLGTTSAELRRLGPGGSITLAGGHRVTIAAVVADTAIGGAEVAVDRATGARLGLTTDRYLLVSHTGDRSAVEGALRAALPSDRPVRFRETGEAPFLRHGDAVLPQALVKQRFGEFAYRPGAGDEFTQDPAWQAEHLVDVDLPIIGRTRCHQGVVPALDGALREVADHGLAGLIDPAGFAGCWNARTTRRGDAPSRHAWGVAVDLNAGANPTGLASVQDPRLVAIFARWGFTEGSGWLVPDAGHFEYVSPPTG